ncbi:MAG: trypsin-like peptidase domain-containing protein [Myxococcota bacterium]
MESVADQKCGDSCGANIKGIREELGNLPTGAIAAGVVVSEHVVAANRHVTNNLQYDIDNARVVFGFQAEPVNGRLPSQLQIHSITRICHSRDANTDLALVQLDGVSLSSLVQAVDFDDQAIEHPTPVVAFGHPWGSSRLMTGHNEHTKIQRCDTGEPEKPGETHATLDSLARSSGSPVYIPKTSKPSEAEEWSLFGIIYGNGENKIVCLDNQYDVIDIDPPPTPCNRGNGTGPLIIPLHPIKQAIETFSNGGKPRGWACHPKDTDNESLAPLGTDTSTNTN